MSSEDILNSLITIEDCKKILNRYLYGESFKLLDYIVCKHGGTTVGFMGDHLDLIIKYKNKNNEAREIRLFIKSMPLSNQDYNSYISETGVLQKEVAVYRNLLPKLASFSRKPFHPKCFLAKKDQCMVLEHLLETGFGMTRSLYLNEDQVVSVLKTLACFHASSLIYEEYHSGPEEKYRLGDYFKEEFVEIPFSFNEGAARYKWCVNTCKALCDLMALVPQCCDAKELGIKLKKFTFKKLPHYFEPSKVYRNVAIHDDLWSNNILFNKYHDSILIDFQQARYMPPVYDVLMFLYQNVERSVLDKNKQKYLDVYYGFITDELSAFNVNLKVFPKDEFEESFNYYLLPALIESTMYGTIIFVSEELSNKIVNDINVFNEYQYTNRSKHVIPEYYNNPDFKKKLNDLFLPLIEELRMIEE